MIITITGKPCSGKGTAAKEFCKQFNFEYMCTGDMFRNYAKQYGYDNILSFQENSPIIKQIDKLIDDNSIEIGKTRINNNIVFDSRLAWHFIPNSFKVFIDVDFETAGKRLFEAKRTSEQIDSIENAVESLKTRWQIENNRYLELYNVNNLNMENYDLIIDSSNLTPNEVVEAIKQGYDKFINQENY